MADAIRATPTAERYGIEITLHHAMQFLATGVGPIGGYAWPVISWGVLGVESATAITLLVIAVRRPSERLVALGWLSVLVSIWLVALAIGYGRPSGFASRYACISCQGLCVVLLTVARYWRVPAWLGIPVSFGLLLALAIPMCRGDWQVAEFHAGVYRVRYHALAADIREGVPVEFLADRHILFPVPAYREGFRLLCDRGHGSLQGVADTPPLTRETISLPTGTRIPAWNIVTDPTPPRLDLPIGSDRPVAAVRLRFRCDDSRYWQKFTLKWVTENREVRESTVFPWLVPGVSTTSFWINDRAQSMWVEPGCPTSGLDLVEIEVYRPATK